MAFTVKVQFKTTEAQKKRIKAAAKRAKVPAAQWLRQAIKAKLAAK